MKPIEWCVEQFDDEPTKWFKGFDHGTHTNGFNDVSVTPEVRDEFLSFLVSLYGEEYKEGEEDFNYYAMIRDLPIDNGLIYIGGMQIAVVDIRELEV